MTRKQLTNAMKAVVASMVVMLTEGKSDEEILEASKTDKIGDKDCTDDLLADLLAFAKEDVAKANGNSVSNGKMFGNKDNEQKYPFPSLWEKHVVVRMSEVAKIGPKAEDVAEIPSSVKIRPFDQSLFDVHVKNGMFNKKTVLIIHDPR